MMKELAKKYLSPVQYRELSAFVKEHLYGWHSRYFAEYGEDSIVNCLLSYKKSGFYVDIGAFHPKRLSSTYYFYKKQNWKGIVIEPNMVNARLFKQKRKRDIVLNCGVGKQNTELTYYMFEDASQNTFDSSFKEDRLKEGMKLINEHKVQVSPLRDLLHKNLPSGQEIDYMNVDVEGLDLEVLKSNDWSLYRPRVITVEDIDFDINQPSASAIYQYLSDQKYKLEAYSYITLIFKRVDDN